MVCLAGSSAVSWKLAYEQNEFIVAKQFLKIAYEKNKGKYLIKGKENEKYKKLAKGLEIGTEAKLEIAHGGEEKAQKQGIHDKIEQLITEGESLLASGKNEAAREKYFEALDFIGGNK